jgi:hypothetical protein
MSKALASISNVLTSGISVKIDQTTLNKKVTRFWIMLSVHSRAIFRIFSGFYSLPGWGWGVLLNFLDEAVQKA